METGTALLIIALIGFSIHSPLFRRFVGWAAGVGVVFVICLFVRMWVVEQHAIEYRASLQMQQSMDAAAKRYVDYWAQGKPNFQDVRVEMARLIQSGEVALLPDGMPDLDTAYSKAMETFIATKYPWIAPPPADKPAEQWLPGQNAKPDCYPNDCIQPRKIRTERVK